MAIEAGHPTLGSKQGRRPRHSPGEPMSATPRSILLSLLAGLSLIAGVAGAGAQAAPKPQPAYDLGGGQGRVEYREYGLNAGVLHSSLTYLPSRWTKAERLPVYVMVHGCGTTA